jgi:hypothetical protein
VPIDLQGRPIGVTVLSLTAFAFSPVLVILLLRFVYAIFTEGTAPSPTQDTGAFVWLCFWLMILTTCFLTLAWVSYRAGLELWRLKRQGLLVAVFTMIIYLVAGIILLLIPGIWAKLTGVAVCAFSVYFLFYLRMPSIEQRFNPPAQKPRA